MIPEIGQYALAIALVLSVLLSTLPLLAAQRNDSRGAALAHGCTRGLFLVVAVAFACLVHAFVVNDFSVSYVAINSNTELPLLYRISAVWGGHEGSLLLWIFTLAGWMVAVSLFSDHVPVLTVARILSVMGMVMLGFLAFTLLTSNPFDRVFPSPVQGRDLNPLLQDPGLAIHPPMLYMGYVGFSVAFAFAIAALIEGKLDGAWARWARPWTNLAWLSLTLGIALGSWWAYYELGWGGWWFWDPVENASFMPWLVGTALVHSLAATEKRGVFKAWTILLAVFAFSLCLLGTFLVRSGVLTSVHAFASDPERGLFILIFLLLVVGGSLLLYALRAGRLVGSSRFELVSRETALLVNNVLLVVAAITVLLGTLYPLILDALGFGKLSVGPPYFNAVFVPLTAPLALIMGAGVIMRWKRDALSRVAKRFRVALVVLLVATIGIVVMLPAPRPPGAIAGLMLGLWVLISVGVVIAERVGGGSLWHRLRVAPASFHGMNLAHAGIGFFILGVTMVSYYDSEQDLRMGPGDQVTVSDLDFRFVGVAERAGPNFDAQYGTIEVYEDGVLRTELHPEKRVYRSQARPLTEAAIDASLWRDIYVSLGEPIGDSGDWAVRIYIKPLVRWIWWGAGLMALGALVSALDSRYRRQTRRELRRSDVRSGDLT
ncbi:heme lyase CcmF/NrfE family subunit [Gammaproteobacteria bacterium]|nr:heme lyase CcmF/NrfE family subunit [Gammaproteobacteria bacterium]